MKLPFISLLRTRLFATCALLVSIAAVPLVAFAQLQTCTNQDCLKLDYMTNPGFESGVGTGWGKEYYAKFDLTTGRPSVRGMRDDGDYEEFDGEVDLLVWFDEFNPKCIVNDAWNQAFEGSGGVPPFPHDWEPTLPNGGCIVH